MIGTEVGISIPVAILRMSSSATPVCYQCSLQKSVQPTVKSVACSICGNLCSRFTTQDILSLHAAQSGQAASGSLSSMPEQSHGLSSYRPHAQRLGPQDRGPGNKPPKDAVATGTDAIEHSKVPPSYANLPQPHVPSSGMNLGQVSKPQKGSIPGTGVITPADFARTIPSIHPQELAAPPLPGTWRSPYVYGYQNTAPSNPPKYARTPLLPLPPLRPPPQPPAEEPIHVTLAPAKRPRIEKGRQSENPVFVSYATLSTLLADLNRLLCTPHVGQEFDFYGTCAVVSDQSVKDPDAADYKKDMAGFLRGVAGKIIAETVLGFNFTELPVMSVKGGALARSDSAALWMNSVPPKKGENGSNYCTHCQHVLTISTRDDLSRPLVKARRIHIGLRHNLVD
ncbi:unnamed protein product [Mycena citricolor]|uniref:Uncharacterized protein n=1 Tax=Mycena citricolor TaxID=2018698 RepID=A0AAD2HQA0_9AGAR|nr:unnamed protein product [Mycena citricolor]